MNAKWHRKEVTGNTPWTKDVNHEWHMEHELLTVVCYLTLPQRSYSTPIFSVSDFETEVIQFADLSVAQSSFVKIPSMAEQASRAKQFHLALAALGLKPHIHPSQLQRTTSAEGDMQMQKEAKLEKSVNPTRGTQDDSSSNDDGSVSSKPASIPSAVGAEGDSWPRLVQIVSFTLTA